MKDEWNRPAAVRWLEDRAAETMGARRRRAHIKWETYRRIRAARRNELVNDDVFGDITVQNDNPVDGLLSVFVPGNDE